MRQELLAQGDELRASLEAATSGIMALASNGGGGLPATPVPAQVWDPRVQLYTAISSGFQTGSVAALANTWPPLHQPKCSPICAATLHGSRGSVSCRRLCCVSDKMPVPLPTSELRADGFFGFCWCSGGRRCVCQPHQHSSVTVVAPGRRETSAGNL